MTVDDHKEAASDLAGVTEALSVLCGGLSYEYSEREVVLHACDRLQAAAEGLRVVLLHEYAHEHGSDLTCNPYRSASHAE